MHDTLAAPIAFARPDLTEREIAEVVAVLRSGWLTTGPRVQEFERRFAEYTGAPHAVAVNSCTAALHLSLLASRIGTGDEVVTTPLTFCATANVIVHAGATPVFADVERDSMNLDPAAAAAAIGPRTRALLPVHMAGRPADVVACRALAGRHGLTLIEDAAHCVEGIAAGRKIGTTADFTCFSFYSTKNLTTGEGGMLTTASEAGARFARIAALHGMSRDAWARYSVEGTAHYDVVMPGFKYNMMDLQAALGLHQLARLQRMHARRVARWHQYDDALADLPLVRPAPVPAGSIHARHLYTVLVDEDRCGWTRDALQRALQQERIGTSIHFRALHLHSYYAERFGLRRGMFPQAEYLSDRLLSLPFSSALRADEVARVAAVLRRLLSRGPQRGDRA
jgi:dTDP-4-amino-4,6-dideoxygalactose transaminase